MPSSIFYVHPVGDFHGVLHRLGNVFKIFKRFFLLSNEENHPLKIEAIFVFSISAGLHGKEGIVGLVVVLVQVRASVCVPTS